MKLQYTEHHYIDRGDKDQWNLVLIKEFCCETMKTELEQRNCVVFSKGRIQLCETDECDGSPIPLVEIDFCPFCGQKIECECIEKKTYKEEEYEEEQVIKKKKSRWVEE